jgi:hypothetical protein
MNDMFKEMCIRQGYIPPTCTIPYGQYAWLLVNKGESPCWGCNEDRKVCNGQEKRY